ncbi:MAG: monovalent cation/H+ antiporter subunit D [Gammaproteobacteria bacterium]|jgi:multicomponent K+:H+ antiporter subunit D|nr:monovalent cation/H+ antiporter subunit D [Gammaproteobacteria bacterium]
MMPALVLLLPLGLGAFFILWPRPDATLRRGLALAAGLWLLAAALWLLEAALNGEPAAATAGGWPAPYGIVLVADALAALLLVVMALLALAALGHAAATDADRPHRGFHALFQLQLFGLAGALLAGDLFNLFVFFEVLLLASYGLLLHAQGRYGRPCPPAVALHYVLLNLMGSTLFLLAVALVYAAAGTLSMSQLAARLGSLPAPDQALAGAGLMLLATVLALKAALLPLLAWLPGTYAAAPAAVAALFTLLTKVGVYGLVRLWTIASGGIATALPGLPSLPSGGDPAHPVAAVLGPVLVTAALATLAAGAVGALAARGLRRLAAWLVPVSVGTLLAGIAAGGTAGLAGALYYLVQSTFITAGLFLLADLLPAAAADGRHGQETCPSQRPAPVLAVLFLLGAMGIAGLPPLSGFIGKALVLSAVAPADGPLWAWIWTGVLAASLALVLALTRTGIRLFWAPLGAGAPAAAAPRLPALLPALALIAMGPLLMVAAGPTSQLAEAVAQRTTAGSGYAAAVAELAPASFRAATGGAGCRPVRRQEARQSSVDCRHGVEPGASARPSMRDPVPTSSAMEQPP